MKIHALSLWLAGAIGCLALGQPCAAGSDAGFGEFNPDVSAIGKFKKSSDQPDLGFPEAEKEYRKQIRTCSISGGVDMTLFFKRLESIGLDTKELRYLTSRINVVFRAPGGDAQAQCSSTWHMYTLGVCAPDLYIPDFFKDAAGNRVKYDLEPAHLGTIVHEYVHAAAALTASNSAASGSTARAHAEVLSYIYDQLRSGKVVYPASCKAKANEVTGYYMDAVIRNLFTTIRTGILDWNASLPQTKDEAQQLGGRVLLPELKIIPGEDPEVTKARKRAVDRALVNFNEATFTALFEGKTPIPWKENQWIKDMMFNNILGLKLPKNTAELVERMNNLDGEEIKQLREKLAKDRIDSAGYAEAFRKRVEAQKVPPSEQK